MDKTVIEQSDPEFKDLARVFVQEGKPRRVLWKGYYWTRHEDNGSVKFFRGSKAQFDTTYGSFRS